MSTPPDAGTARRRVSLSAQSTSTLSSPPRGCRVRGKPSWGLASNGTAAERVPTPRLQPRGQEPKCISSGRWVRTRTARRR